jgi:hypothetical protein
MGFGVSIGVGSVPIRYSAKYRSYHTSRRAYLTFSRHSFHVSAVGSSSCQLSDWILENGGTVDGVQVHSWHGADGGSGYGVKAMKNLKRGDELITLPERCQLTYEAGKDPMILKLWMDKIPSELWGAKLALKLLHERIEGEQSHFWPYIQNLPLGFPGLPLFFDRKVIELIEYPPVVAQINMRCRWLLQFSQELQAVRGTQEDPFRGVEVDANVLGWSFAAVSSRAFRPGGPKSPGTLLPLIDMCNHSFSPNAKVVGSGKPGNNSLSMVAIKDIAIDEPILLSYGNLPNDFLLLDYGFVITQNPYDTVKLAFDVGFIEGAKAVANVGSMAEDLSGNIQLKSWQKSMLEDLNLFRDKEVQIVQSSTESDSPFDARLLAGVRILCAPKESECKKFANHLGEWNSQLPIAAWEISSLKTLMGMCLIALSQFSSSSKQDATLISTSDADSALAIRFRKEKKDILSAALNILRKRIEQAEIGKTSPPSPSGRTNKKAQGKGFGN